MWRLVRVLGDALHLNQNSRPANWSGFLHVLPTTILTRAATIGRMQRWYHRMISGWIRSVPIPCQLHAFFSGHGPHASKKMESANLMPLLQLGSWYCDIAHLGMSTNTTRSAEQESRRHAEVQPTFWLSSGGVRQNYAIANEELWSKTNGTFPVPVSRSAIRGLGAWSFKINSATNRCHFVEVFGLPSFVERLSRQVGSLLLGDVSFLYGTVMQADPTSMMGWAAWTTNTKFFN